MFWMDTIRKEMENVKPVFRILEDGPKAPIGCQKIRCHMIFDVKLDFTHKTRFVAGGHMTEPPATLTYLSVVAHDPVRTTLLVEALNGLDILV